ncbi:TPA: hypothetical protein DD394_08035 [bacterium UBP9_UBA11836]|nr:hypothetical protein [bacterium UBP9_UBA11836]
MQKKTTIIICSIAATLLVAFLAFYYGYWKNTPIYSLTLVKTAIENHDWQTFEARVDLDSVLKYAYDDAADSLIEQQLGKNNLLSLVKGQAFLKNAANLVKNDAVEMAKKRIRGYVSGEDSGDNDFVERSGFKSIDFSFFDSLGFGAAVVEYTVVENKAAVMGVRLYPRGFTNEFVMQLEMQNENGVWRLKRIKNLKELLDKLQED